ncbi:N-acetylmuramoyl-L-alanine amidase [Clostridium sp. JN-1]|jgi:N-acetylmuramoyl-L-alanine amidase|uniref:N-acetylmuramoyl-L-alanine amidase family protein n=1 Tax=Clostridium sp. JN-1 TaxID=2483110 RepID=UPI000F0B0FBD|nr:N-acetylmuramoyl-L-alanine amidase [Clostridium sp. JN-1]
MRIANRKKFMLSCIFFTLLSLLFGKNQVLCNGGSTVKGQAVMASSKDKGVLIKHKQENNKYTIVLDAGHGGVDNGTSYGNMYEKNLTLKIVKYAQEYLENEGYNVALTRNSDVLVPLKEIGSRVNAANGDVFVSVHINSINDTDFNGITTLYYDPKGYQTNQRIKLSEILENQAVKSDNWNSKGIKKQNVAVLRYSKIPCALVECGFITNKDDRDKLSKDSVLKNLAQNISDGIIKYLDSGK